MKIIWQALLLKGGAPIFPEVQLQLTWTNILILFTTTGRLSYWNSTTTGICDLGHWQRGASGMLMLIAKTSWNCTTSTFPRLRFVHTPVRTANTASSSAVPCGALRGSFVRVLVLGVLSSMLPRWSSYGSSVKAWVVADQTTLGPGNVIFLAL